MPTACVNPTLENGVKGESNRVGDNSVQLYTNPCPPFMAILIIQGCSISTVGLMSLCVGLYCRLGAKVLGTSVLWYSSTDFAVLVSTQYSSF